MMFCPVSVTYMVVPFFAVPTINCPELLNNTMSSINDTIGSTMLPRSHRAEPVVEEGPDEISSSRSSGDTLTDHRDPDASVHDSMSSAVSVLNEKTEPP